MELNLFKDLSSGSLETLYHFAHSYYKQGKYEDAEGLFRFLTVANTHTRKYWMGLGASLQMRKVYDKAIESYELAAALDPTDPQVHLYAADCYFGMSKKEEGLFALDCAERAIKLSKPVDSENLLAHLALIRKAWNN